MPKQAYVFAQLLGLLPRYQFQRIVEKYNGDFRTKQFKCWHQLACMMFAQIRQETSLRDIDIALNAYASKLYHIGIQQCPRSTLAVANERRDHRIYEEFAKSLMQKARREYAHTALALEVNNAVYALDADAPPHSRSSQPKVERRHAGRSAAQHGVRWTTDPSGAKDSRSGKEHPQYCSLDRWSPQVAAKNVLDTRDRWGA